MKSIFVLFWEIEPFVDMATDRLHHMSRTITQLLQNPDVSPKKEQFGAIIWKRGKFWENSYIFWLFREDGTLFNNWGIFLSEVIYVK